MAQFNSILTNVGLAKISNAIALGRTITLTQMALGDGNGTAVTPTQDQTALVKEVYRAQLSSLDTDPDNPAYVIAELVVPHDQGGWHVREVGVFDDENELIAIANFPETYKPVALEGSARDLIVRLYIEVGNAENIQLKVDGHQVIATRKWANDTFSKKADLAGPSGAAMLGLSQGGKIQDAIDYVTPQMFGFNKDADNIEAALRYAAEYGCDVYFGGKHNTYVLDREIDLIDIPEMKGIKIWGGYPEIRNLNGGCIRLPTMWYSEISGLRFIGGAETERSPGTALYIPMLMESFVQRNRFENFHTGFDVDYSILATIQQNVSMHCDIHFDFDTTGVHNLIDFRSNVLFFAVSKTLPYWKATDVGLRLSAVDGGEVALNAFEFPQAAGLMMSNVASIEVRKNYFEHGRGGSDIIVASQYTGSVSMKNNFHGAGSGDGGTSGGHRPASLNASNMRLDAAGNELDGYHDDNVDARYTAPSVSYQKAARLSREIAYLDASQTANLLVVKAMTDARAILKLTTYQMRSTNGIEPAVAEHRYVITNVGGTVTATLMDSNTTAGIPGTATATVDGDKVLLAFTNTTGAAIVGNYEAELMHSRGLATIQPV